MLICSKTEKTACPWGQTAEKMQIADDQTESRSMRVEGSRMRLGRVVSPWMRSVMTRAAVMPISTVGTSMVVRGGLAYWLISMLLMPMMLND